MIHVLGDDEGIRFLFSELSIQFETDCLLVNRVVLRHNGGTDRL